MPLPFAAIGADDAGTDPRTPIAGALVGVLVAACALAYAYGLNAITDRHFDRSSEKNPLRGLAFVPRSALVAVGLSATLALVITWVALGPIARAAVALSLSGASVYSLGPRTKSIPILGTLTNVVIFVPLLFVGVAGPEVPPMGTLLVVFAGLLLQNQLIHELADVDEDASADDLSTARLIGRPGVCVATVAIAAVIAAWLATAPAAARWLACVVLALGALVPWVVEAPARARAAHRALASVGGALVFLVERGSP